MNYEHILRGIVIVLFIARYMYWRSTEKPADTKKPKAQNISIFSRFKKLIMSMLWLFVLLQAAGLQALPLETNMLTKVIGTLMVWIGVTTAIAARKDLGHNWAHAAEYQIKKEHALVTNGVYKRIRHPIYTGLLLSVIGAELVVGSYLIFVFITVFPIALYLQAKKEEQILLDHFGKEYALYMKKSKMFIPYIF